MGLLARLLGSGPQARGWGDGDDKWYSPLLPNSESGEAVTADTALTQSAVFSCTRILAETLGHLPLNMFRTDSEGVQTRAENHPLQDLLHDQPNSTQTSMEWREQMMQVAVLRGVAFSEIRSGPRGPVSSLNTLHPDRVTIELLPPDGERYLVKYREASGQERIISQDDLLRLLGPFGLSIVQAAKRGIGLALATEGFGSRLFGQALTHRGVLEHPGKVSPGAWERLMEALQRQLAGPEKAHGTLLLEEGMKWTQVSMQPDDAQFLETRQFQVREIARWFRMQAHKIGDLENATFSNIEHLGIEFVTDTLMPWILRWEQAIKRDLILRPDVYSAKFNVSALLRGDIESRYKAYQIGRMGGWLSANKILEFEEMNPIEEEWADRYWMPINMRFADEPTPAAAPALTEGGSEPAAKPEETEEEPQGVASETLAAALQVTRIEQAALSVAAPRYASNKRGWAQWVASYYGRHAAVVAGALKLPDDQARAYCERQREDVTKHGVGLAGKWEQRTVELAELAEACRSERTVMVAQLMEGSHGQAG